ncbi:signal peptidase I [Pseudanabaena sp. UWO311]|uniref:signal peptidase I n=1 Tax=Pseudanabaena sp. UWO311 TaxID=2487337 RepID=UPI00115B7C6D|nr:signal peptidase I [Pseudanabaena sp. UWO311]TYQ26346.1 signal peptidase I [Pseudanabaena sp. UWO311]
MPQTSRNSSQPPKKSKRSSFWQETAQTVGLTIALAFGVRVAVAQAYYLPPSGSMEPTLQNYDRVIVDKLSYRFQTPQRFDIVVFEPNEAVIKGCGLSAEKQKSSLIKRVIGLPGDRVEIKEGVTYINGKALSEPYLVKAPEYDLPLTIVPANSYFALGDNRNNSCDGHIWGFVPKENIIGKATLRYWPLDHFGNIDRKD